MSRRFEPMKATVDKDGSTRRKLIKEIAPTWRDAVVETLCRDEFPRLAGMLDWIIELGRVHGELFDCHSLGAAGPRVSMGPRGRAELNQVGGRGRRP